MNVPRFKRSPIDTSVFNRMRKEIEDKPDMVESIRRVVKNVTGVDPLSDNVYKGSEVVESRQLFMYFVRKHTKLSQYATGRLVGKDHATVNHAVKTVEKFREIETDYCIKYDCIEAKIKKLTRSKR